MPDLFAIAHQALPAFGLEGAALERISRRAESGVFRLEDEEGSPHVLRIQDARALPDEVADLQLAWLEATAAAAAVSVARPRSTRDGKPYVSVEREDTPFRVVLLSWVPGSAIPIPLAMEHVRAVGSALAQLHAAAAGIEASGSALRRFDHDFFFAPWRGARAEATALSAAQHEILRRADERVAEALDAIGDRASGLVHGDSNYANLVLDGDRIGVLDFDEMGQGCQLFDLAEFLRTIAHWPNIDELAATVVAGYTSVRPLPDDLLGHLDTLLAATFVSVVNWAFEIEDPSEQWSHFEHFPLYFEQIERRIS